MLSPWLPVQYVYDIYKPHLWGKQVRPKSSEHGMFLDFVNLGESSTSHSLGDFLFLFRFDISCQWTTHHPAHHWFIASFLFLLSFFCSSHSWFFNSTLDIRLGSIYNQGGNILRLFERCRFLDFGRTDIICSVLLLLFSPTLWATTSSGCISLTKKQTQDSTTWATVVATHRK